jgi:hypothetical protein
VAAMLLAERDRRGAILRFLVGGAIPSAVTVVYFAAVGALHRAIDGFVIINLLYTQQPSALSKPGETWTKLWQGYHVTLFLAIAGAVSLIVLAARAVPLARSHPTSPLPRRVVIAGAAGAAASIWTILIINGAPDLWVVLPFAALGLGGGALFLASAMGRRRGTGLLVACICVGVVGATIESATSKDHILDQQRDDVAAVLATQPANAQVLSVSASQPLALSGRVNPTGYQLFDPSMDRYLAHTYPGGLKGYAARIKRMDPTFIAVKSTYKGGWIESLLREQYQRVGSTGLWIWYLSRSAGPAALARAREANALVMHGHAAQ